MTLSIAAAPRLQARAPFAPWPVGGFAPPRVAAATHPVEPEPLPPDDEPAAPNPTHLPIEPEFGPMPPAAQPEDPRGKPPQL